MVQLIKKDSDEEKNFIKLLRKDIMCLNTSTITDKDNLQAIIIQMAFVFEDSWILYSKLKQITKHSKK